MLLQVMKANIGKCCWYTYKKELSLMFFENYSALCSTFLQNSTQICTFFIQHSEKSLDIFFYGRKNRFPSADKLKHEKLNHYFIKSIHPFSYPGSGRGSQTSLPSPQPLGGIPKAFPGQPKNIVPPLFPGFSTGCPLSKSWEMLYKIITSNKE